MRANLSNDDDNVQHGSASASDGVPSFHDSNVESGRDSSSGDGSRGKRGEGGSGEGGGGGEAGDGDDGRGDRAWYTLNAFSAAMPHRGGLPAGRLLSSTSHKSHKVLRPPSARHAPKSSKCPRSVHLKPPPPRPKLSPRSKPPPRGGLRPVPAIAPPKLVPPAVTNVPPKLVPPSVTPVPPSELVPPPVTNVPPRPVPPTMPPVPTPPSTAPPSPPLQQPVPQPRPPINTGAPNSSQTPSTAPSPPAPGGLLGPIYLAAALYRSSRVGGTPELTFPPPATVDWTKTGKLTPVKVQGSTCSSCWANSAVSAVEAALSIAYGTPPVAYSRQILVDCARLSVAGEVFAHDDGCYGGDAADALIFMNLYTLPTEDAYPYISDALGIAGTCNDAMMTLPDSDSTWLEAGSIVNYPANSEVSLQAALAVQPVVVYWNMGYNFRSYGGGLYDIADQTDPVYGCVTSAYSSNHAMMAVGYDASSNYWIIQNSFGTGWGEQGFIRVRMTGNTVGPCGMYWYVIAPSFNFKRVPTGYMPGHPPPPPVAPPEIGCMPGIAVDGYLIRRFQGDSMAACRAECLIDHTCTFVVWDGAHDCQLKSDPLIAGYSVRPSVTGVTIPGGTCFLQPDNEGKYLCSQGTSIVAAKTPASVALPEVTPIALKTCQSACTRDAQCLFFMWASRADSTASCSLYYDRFTLNSTFVALNRWPVWICFLTTQTS